jgi:hypothetical protein
MESLNQDTLKITIGDLIAGVSRHGNQKEGISEGDLHYLGGLVDGEGFICITKRANKSRPKRNPTYELRVGITNTNRKMIDWIQSLFPSCEFGVRGKDPVKHKRWYRVEFIANQGLNFLRIVGPYIRFKSEQVEIGISFQEHMRATSLSSRARVRRLGSAEFIPFRESCHQRMRLLNKKGPTTVIPLAETKREGSALQADDAIVRTA